MSPRSAFLLGLGVIAVVGVGWQRHRSPFLTIAGERQAAQRVAHAVGVDEATVMALRWMWGEVGGKGEARWYPRVRRWHTLQQAFGTGPALLDSLGLADAAAVRDPGAEDRGAEGGGASRGDGAVEVARFAAVRARFAAYLGHSEVAGG